MNKLFWSPCGKELINLDNVVKMYYWSGHVYISTVKGMETFEVESEKEGMNFIQKVYYNDYDKGRI